MRSAREGTRQRTGTTEVRAFRTSAPRSSGPIGVLLLAMLLTTGCAFDRLVANRIADALAAEGTTFSADDDPELVKAAVPFSLKLMESVLASTPEHRGLLVALCKGFTQYGYAFVQQESERQEDIDLSASRVTRDRARRLYLRARGFGLRALDASHPHLSRELREDARLALLCTTRKDVPALYWTAASWAASVGVSKDQPELIKDLPIVDALIDRVLELEEDFSNGAVHSLLISYELSRPGPSEEQLQRSTQHFERALELTEGRAAGPLVAYAESVAVQRQDLVLFRSLLRRALAIDPDGRPEWRLANLIMQERARWLRTREDDLFLFTQAP